MDEICEQITRRWITGALVMLALLSGCGDRSDDAPAGADAETFAALKLNAVENCDAYKTYVSDSLVEQYRPRAWPPRLTPTDDIDSLPGGALPTSSNGTAGEASSAPLHVTGTNAQEAGVDEPDIVKADTNGVLYIARGNFLRIVAGYPAKELKELAALDAGGNIYDLFLDEAQRRVVIFAAHYSQGIPVALPGASISMTSPGYYQRTQYIVSFVDVANPAQPVLTSRWTLDGYPLDARRVDTRVHFVLSASLELPAVLAGDSSFWDLYTDYYAAPTTDAASAIEQQIIDAIRTAVNAIDAAALLPSITIETGGQTNAGPIVSCSAVLAPSVLTRPSLLTVASFDTDGGNRSASAITADGATVYASPTNLYVTQSSGGWFGSDELKPQTAIHQFSVSGATPKYVATGIVDGWIRNAFNLSEYEENLRVATNTTIWNKGTTTQTNDLFVLRDNGSGVLAQRGAVRNFGEGESLFSARFLGTRGFVVTFRRVDPLFAFDLSDPDNPQLVGELTIPGFSTYMHPLGDLHLLTIGRDAGTAQTQLQIFDVTDLTAPKLAHAHTPALPGSGYSYSSAEYDHHAFTFDETNNVLAIPFSYASNSGGEYFNGIAAFKIDVVTGINEVVRVDHGDLATKANCNTLPAIVPCDYSFAAYPSRSVFMTAENGVMLYSISDAGVKATDLAPPNAALGTVVFPLDPVPPIVLMDPQ